MKYGRFTNERNPLGSIVVLGHIHDDIVADLFDPGNISMMDTRDVHIILEVGTGCPK